jgi:hypothetical protein
MLMEYEGGSSESLLLDVLTAMAEKIILNN